MTPSRARSCPGARRRRWACRRRRAQERHLAVPKGLDADGFVARGLGAVVALAPDVPIERADGLRIEGSVHPTPLGGYPASARAVTERVRALGRGGRPAALRRGFGPHELPPRPVPRRQGHRPGEAAGGGDRAVRDDGGPSSWTRPTASACAPCSPRPAASRTGPRGCAIPTGRSCRGGPRPARSSSAASGWSWRRRAAPPSGSRPGPSFGAGARRRTSTRGRPRWASGSRAAREPDKSLLVVAGHAPMLGGRVDDPEAARGVREIPVSAERRAGIVPILPAMARPRPAQVTAASIGENVEAALEVAGHGLKTPGAQVVLGLDPAPAARHGRLRPDRAGLREPPNRRRARHSGPAPDLGRGGATSPSASRTRARGWSRRCARPSSIPAPPPRPWAPAPASGSPPATGWRRATGRPSRSGRGPARERASPSRRRAARTRPPPGPDPDGDGTSADPMLAVEDDADMAALLRDAPEGRGARWPSPGTAGPPWPTAPRGASMPSRATCAWTAWRCRGTGATRPRPASPGASPEPGAPDWRSRSRPRRCSRSWAR